MCGLVGIAGALEVRDEEAFKRLLINNYHRGRDATGMAALRNNGEVKIAKLSSHPFDLFDMGKFKDAMNAYQSTVFLGHNRHATRGGLSSYNAHPFQYRHIVGAHNGTLDDRSQKELEKLVGEEFAVDSAAIIAAIAIVGIEETVSALQGSWALSYINLQDGTLNFIRNKERPLWWCATKDGKFIYWASEWPTIQAGMFGEYRTLWRDKTGHAFFGMEENIHYSFDLKTLKAGGNRPKPKCKKMEGKESFLVTGSGGNGHRTPLSDPFRREGTVIGLPKTTSLTTTSHRGTGNDNQNPIIVHLEGTEEEPFAGRISRERFEDLAREGCSFCQTKIEWGAKGIAIYERDDIVLCAAHSPCGDKEHTRVYLPKIPSPAN